MKVLITGGGGFIGSYVVKELLLRDCEVVIYDIVGDPVVRHKGVKYVHGTILDKFTMCKHIRGCDAVLHLAALLGVRRVAQEQLRCLSINIEGTVNVLEACINEKIPYVLFTSSSEIYGDASSMNSKKMICEEGIWNPKSNYAISKLVGEKYIKAFQQEYGIDYNIIRFFNVYGPGQTNEFVIPKFINMSMQKNPPTIYGDGRQVRSFCYIEDAAKGLVKAFMNPNTRNQIFNIGNSQEPIAMSDLAKKIAGKIDPKLKPVHIPFEESDRTSRREIHFRIPDINKAKKLLDYMPRVDLESGIDKMIRFRKEKT